MQDQIADALRHSATPEELARAAVPREYIAAHVCRDDVGMFNDDADKDVRRSLRVGLVPMPELAPDEVLVAVMASSVNYNTIWAATFEPVSTFESLRRYAARGCWERRHDRPYHVLGSDAAGVIVRIGAGVRRWRIGDHVVITAVQADDQEPATHADGMLGEGQRAWGYETNFGGLAHYTIVRASQVLPKAAHLTWEEAASMPACASTAYRMLISDRGARMKQGDVVLIWGAAGGLGVHAVQLVRNGGGIAVGVVSSNQKADALRRLGCDVVINRDEVGIDTSSDDPADVHEAGLRLGARIRRECGEDPHIVFEYVGKATFGLSLFVVRRGGAVVTCGSSTGYWHHYDNRYLWMKLKRILGSHGANLQEQWECNRLACLGRLVPCLTEIYPLEDIATATRVMQGNGHFGKLGVLCMAQAAGLGVTDHERRAHLGERALNPLREI